MTITADTLNRTKKLLLDTGEVPDIHDLDAAFASYGMVLTYTQEQVSNFEGQLTLVTMLNLATRCMDGQVELRGPLDIRLSLPGHEDKTIRDVANEVGVASEYKARERTPVLALVPGVDAIAPLYAGWRAAAIGAGCRLPFESTRAQPLAVTAAAALAVNEAFHVLRKDHLLGGRRVVGLNLWRPDVRAGWESVEHDGPAAVPLDAPLLLVGLGHLGQAYLWTLSMQLATAPKNELWLQDDDFLTESTWSTSMLTPKAFRKVRKTRLVARTLESMGFQTRIVESRLLRPEQFTQETPKLVLFGTDNPQARRLISRLPALVLVEAGLGERHDTFRGVRVHGFPQSQDSSEIWAERSTVVSQEPTNADDNLAPAYRRELERTKDRCGTTTLASKSVGVPFVGCFASSLVLAELFRRVHGAPGNALLDLDMRDIADRYVVQ